MLDSWNVTDTATRLGDVEEPEPVGPVIVLLDCSGRHLPGRAGRPKVVVLSYSYCPPLSLFDIPSTADRCPDIEMRHFAEGDEVTDGHTTVQRVMASA